MTMRLVSKNLLGRVEAVAEVSSLPGCSQIAVIHSSFVQPEARGTGAGTRAHRDRLVELFSDLLYDVAIATVETSNKPQMKIMEKHGWTQATVFQSRRTGHYVAIFIKHLDEASYIE